MVTVVVDRNWTAAGVTIAVATVVENESLQMSLGCNYQSESEDLHCNITEKTIGDFADCKYLNIITFVIRFLGPLSK